MKISKKRCKICVMNEGRVHIHEDGICQACKNYANRKNVDWQRRWKELEKLCDKHRRTDGGYDSIITVSGGKDSSYQTWLFKEVLHMNPLCVMVDNFSWSQTGVLNYNNLGERFGVDIYKISLNRKAAKILTIDGLVNEFRPNLYWDRALFCVPLQIAVEKGIKLVIWGEDPSYFKGGSYPKETPDALIQLKIVAPDNFKIEDFCVGGLTPKDLQTCILPPKEKLDELDAIFTSYYVPWNSHENTKKWKEFGGKGFGDTGEWNRKGLEYLDDMQVDTVGYLINNYCKFIKFGFSNQTEQCSIAIREGLIDREEGIRRVNAFDWELDHRMLVDFLSFIDMSEEEFHKLVDKFANRDLLEKDPVLGLWRLKENAR